MFWWWVHAAITNNEILILFFFSSLATMKNSFPIKNPMNFVLRARARFNNTKKRECELVRKKYIAAAAAALSNVYMCLNAVVVFQRSRFTKQASTVSIKCIKT